MNHRNKTLRAHGLAAMDNYVGTVLLCSLRYHPPPPPPPPNDHFSAELYLNGISWLDMGMLYIKLFVINCLAAPNNISFFPNSPNTIAQSVTSYILHILDLFSINFELIRTTLTAYERDKLLLLTNSGGGAKLSPSIERTENRHHSFIDVLTSWVIPGLVLVLVSWQTARKHITITTRTHDLLLWLFSWILRQWNKHHFQLNTQ